jgi:tetrathionate reductase subunit B
MAACKAENEVPLSVWRIWLKEIETGTYPHVRRFVMPLLCNMCAEPACVQVCPTRATFQNPDGLVVVNPHVCIGCRYCMAACPYGVRHLNPATGHVEKCHFCLHRLERGLDPVCVESCPTGAILIGDLGNPASEVSRALSGGPVQVLKPEFGTEPQGYYRNLDGRLPEFEERY